MFQPQTPSGASAAVTIHANALECSPIKRPFDFSGKITEIIMQDDHEYNFQLLMPLLAQLSQDERWFAWIAPPLKLPKAWLKQAGIDLNKVMMLMPSENHGIYELAQQALKAGTCHAVISWPGALNDQELKGLEAAAKTGHSHGILIRPR
jgi:cell division inhibitor SulA